MLQVLPIGLLGFFFLLLLSMSQQTADSIRSFAVGVCAPLVRGGEKMRSGWSKRPMEQDPLPYSRLALENRMLQSEIEWIKAWIAQNREVRETIDGRSPYLHDLLQRQLRAIPATVIYRDPTSWSSALWINVGEEDNRIYGTTLITRNSPVVEGNCLVGVVDYVGKRQSRVR